MFKDIDIKWVAAALGLVLTIGGGFVKYGEIMTKLEALSKIKESAKVNATAISEVDKNSKINGKEIELLKLQIREIQAKSGNPLSN
jgi:hypothetical protein|tara:strand:+ start:503 stop:760 length:258 start_codon:yes stop_codon:yes gene_type:complete